MARLARLVFHEVASAKELQGKNLLLVCCQALTPLLDSFSGVVTADEQRRNIGVELETDGVGLDLEDNGGAGALFIKGVFPGGPAQRAGVRPGDEITHLDGASVQGIPPAVVLRRMNQGERGVGQDVIVLPRFEPVQLRLIRTRDRKPYEVSLLRDHFRVETVLGVQRREDNRWDYLLDRRQKIAYVRLTTLGRGTSDELRDVVSQLSEEGLRGLVLDLRWCPGGFLTEAVEAAGLFLGECTVATVKSRGKTDEVYRSVNEEKVLDLPLIVLINSETSGGAELIAAALQDHQRAQVVGQRTRGKGSVQTPIPLGVPGVGFKLTTGTFVRPGGQGLNRFPTSKATDDWGVRPSPGGEFRISADLSRALHRWYDQHALRPGSSSERLPLDTPTADPQRQAALTAILEASRR
jgi:carboxyl-terminal processing protease